MPILQKHYTIKNPLHFKITITALMLLIFFAFYTPHAQAENLPDLGAPDLIEYNQQREKKLGKAFLSSLHTNYNLNNDPEILSYVRNIGHRITTKTSSYHQFKFFVINNPSINAFAGPDGIIGIHTGLISAVDSEAELASVISHEIAHVTQNHISRRYQFQSSESNLASVATILAAILIGIYDPNAAMATLMGGMGYSIEQQLKNSRLHETEADAVGIKLLNQAGYNPHAMAAFFGHLSNLNQNNTFAMPEILRSHPVSERRLASAENRALSLPPLKRRVIDNSLKLIKLRIKYNNNSAYNNISNHLFTADSQTSTEICYELALINRNQSKTQRLNIPPCLERLVKKYLEQPLYTTLLLELEANQTTPQPINQKLLKYADYQLAVLPNNSAVLIRYVNFLVSINQIDNAINLLKNSATNQTYQYQIYKKLSELYAQLGQNKHAYYYQARAEFSMGDIKKTQYLLKQAEKITLEKNNSIQKAIILFKIKYHNLLKNKAINK